MPADFSPYVDLRIFDKEPGDIYRDAIEIARLGLPEFNLRPGTPEDAIIQAVSYISSLNVAAINRLPNRIMSGVMGVLGFQRQESVPGEVDVTIVLNSYDGGTVPAGTAFGIQTIFEDEILDIAFQLMEPLEIAETDLDLSLDYPSASATLISFEGGVLPPLGNNQELNVLSAGTNILSCTTNNPSNFINGINADTDEYYLSKAVTHLRSLTSAIAKSTQLDAYLLNEYPDTISRSKTYDLTKTSLNEPKNLTVKREIGIDTIFLNSNIATVLASDNHLYVVGDVVEIEIFDNAASSLFNGNHTITATSDTTFSFVRVGSNTASTNVSGSAYSGSDAPGFVSVFCYGQNAFLSSTQKTQIKNDIASKSVAGLTINIFDPPLVVLNIFGGVYVNQNFIQSEVELTVKNILIDFLSPNSYPYTYDRIRKNQLISIIASVPGVVYVDDFTIEQVGAGWLPQHGEDVLFLQKGTLPIISEDNLNLTFEIWETDQP